jgi:Bacterial Ig domain
MATSRNLGKTLRLFSLHQICSDPDWDSFMITGASSTSAAGGSALINGGSILYWPPLDFVGTDSFTYTVRDSRGASSQGTVQVTVSESTAPGNTIPSLFNTGVDWTGTILTEGTIGDPHYALVSLPSGTTEIRVRTSVGGWPIPPYIGDDSLSAWIGPNSDSSLDGPVGVFVYRTTFDLCGFDPSTAQIDGQSSSDNESVDILLNGVSIGNGANPQELAFQSWTPFTMSVGFVAGVNTLDFIVNNDGGPTALRVEMSGTASPLPGAPTYALGTSRNQVARMSLAKLERACPNSGALTLTGVSPNSTAGGTVQLNGGTIVYTPPSDFVGADSFTYIVRDGSGTASQGTIKVTVTAPTGNGLNIINVTVAPGGAATIHCAGIPGVTYVVEASTDLAHWTTLGSATAGPNGLFDFVDTGAGIFSSRYYRTRADSAVP